jgi:hypothetical protein
MANFGRGLKQQRESVRTPHEFILTVLTVEKNKKMSGHGRWRSQGGATGAPMSANPNRMSID